MLKTLNNTANSKHTSPPVTTPRYRGSGEGKGRRRARVRGGGGGELGLEEWAGGC